MVKAAEDGAKIAIAAKTAEPHPKLPGTIYTAADEIVEAGGEALQICDIEMKIMSGMPLIKLLIILVELIFVLIMLQQFNNECH